MDFIELESQAGAATFPSTDKSLSPRRQAHADRYFPDARFWPTFHFSNHFPIIPSFVTITSCYPIVLN
jgi:hypothetical protein